eukprot:NODE_5208_length_684_cov_124.535009_g5045_i0.p1 GENE.NODE_5208_length_684_cov_124.535009_g5045_i0~~NODE_5208_length_684_cov_124.535009_g5045_i0.p1  ORF type:complete len:207 (+),score=49.84 NODE_5208_length_684_cov_124.535009_g5045_i0:55-621(+)
MTFSILILLFGWICSGDVIFSSIDGIIKLPKPVLQKGVRVIVDGGATVYVYFNGTYRISALAPGPHLLAFDAPGYVFPQVRVDVSKKNAGRIRAIVLDEELAHRPGNALLLEPKGVAEYFVAREEYNMFGILKNPMVIMMLIAFGGAFLLPKMADPEQMKEMSQLNQDGGTPSLSQLWQQLTSPPSEK